MKLRVADRILVALAGVIILAGCAAVVAQVFFQADVIGFATRVLTSESTKARAAVIGGTVVLFLLGVYCLFVLFRHRSRRDKFIMQKNDSGDLTISIKALENMVAKCLEQHPEIKVQQMFLQSQRDGLLIRLRGSVAGGISIPLTVEAAQRQIKQYVTACSGVEIKNITVEIDSSGPEADNAPFRILPPTRPLLNDESRNSQGTEKAVATAPETPTAPAASAAQTARKPETAGGDDEVRSPAPMESPVTTGPAATVNDDDDDDRPLHQRLFKPQNEPLIVPAPPAEAETGASAAVEETAEEAGESVGEETREAAESGKEIIPEADEKVSEEADEAGADEVNTSGEEGSEAEEKTNEEKARLAEARKAFEEAQSIFDGKVTGKTKGEDEP